MQSVKKPKKLSGQKKKNKKIHSQNSQQYDFLKRSKIS